MPPTTADTELRAINTITVGHRRRTGAGDLVDLARSIQKYGLLHPVVIDDTGTLVAGERRLRACQHIGWTDIPVRSIGTLSASELHVIELEENIRRKDLTPAERTRTLIQIIGTTRDVLRDQAASIAAPTPTPAAPADASPRPTARGAAGPAGPNTAMKDRPAGPAARPDSDARVAAEIGVAEATITRARQHSAALRRRKPSGAPAYVHQILHDEQGETVEIYVPTGPSLSPAGYQRAVDDDQSRMDQLNIRIHALAAECLTYHGVQLALRYDFPEMHD